MGYDEWRERAMGKAEEKVLATLEGIVADAGKELSGGELDDMKDCLKILHMIQDCRNHKGHVLPGVTMPGK